MLGLTLKSGRKANATYIKDSAAGGSVTDGPNKQRQGAKSAADTATRHARFSQKERQIIDGALRAFLSRGYSASMDAIAQEAGVSKQTVYSHFKDKETLFSALIDQLLDEFTTAGLSPDLMTQEPETFFRNVANIALSRLDDWEYISLLRVLIAESARFPELADVYVTRLVTPAIHKLTEFISNHKTIKFKDPEATARIVHGSLVYFIIMQEILNGKNTLPMSRERIADAIVEMIMRETASVEKK